MDLINVVEPTIMLWQYPLDLLLVYTRLITIKINGIKRMPKQRETDFFIAHKNLQKILENECGTEWFIHGIQAEWYKSKYHSIKIKWLDCLELSNSKRILSVRPN